MASLNLFTSATQPRTTVVRIDRLHCSLVHLDVVGHSGEHLWDLSITTSRPVSQEVPFVLCPGEVFVIEGLKFMLVSRVLELSETYVSLEHPSLIIYVMRASQPEDVAAHFREEADIIRPPHLDTLVSSSSSSTNSVDADLQQKLDMPSLEDDHDEHSASTQTDCLPHENLSTLKPSAAKLRRADLWHAMMDEELDESDGDGPQSDLSQTVEEHDQNEREQSRSQNEAISIGEGINKDSENPMDDFAEEAMSCTIQNGSIHLAITKIETLVRTADNERNREDITDMFASWYKRVGQMVTFRLDTSSNRHYKSSDRYGVP
eukprot:GILK01006917.1.p1 GENE.GILK01006917.1~~GILK01006917.1.p1  ORF type:complete len:319 (-),score=39.25 GILK01006917.1:3-959(-)